jgi:phosphatidylserine/phosphatidylglycerophosphate/cardiolipin synthase-like enzyme
MTGLLQKLSDSDLQEIALAIRSGRLALPYSTIALQRLVLASAAPSVASDLQWLSERGFAPEQLAVALDMLIADRRARPRLDNLLELVTTGPEVAGIANRDTSVVVRDLFTNARESVLLAGYAIYQGQRVFQALADRMLAVPALKVRLFLDIQRAAGDTSEPAELMMRFADRFRSQQWPKERPMPEVYFDPRSLEPDPRERACLHAKCVVVDRQTVFVSSANFTEAAQRRNLEIGLLIRSGSLANQITGYFNELLARDMLAKVIV